MGGWDVNVLHSQDICMHHDMFSDRVGVGGLGGNEVTNPLYHVLNSSRSKIRLPLLLPTYTLLNTSLSPY
jgi:hypothetical protein